MKKNNQIIKKIFKKKKNFNEKNYKFALIKYNKNDKKIGKTINIF